MGSRYLIASDVERVMLGNVTAVSAVSLWWKAHRHLLRLAYVSSQSYDSVMKRVAEHPGLPEPDAVIGASGTEIVLSPDVQPNAAWRQTISRRWDAERIRTLLSDVPQLNLSPEEQQSMFRVSYRFDLASNDQLKAVERRIRDNGLEADLLYTAKRDLEIVPAGANKGAAVAFLQKRWSIPHDKVIVVGAAENDRTLFDYDFRGVVVGNADPGLRMLASPRVYHALQPDADGFLEGVRYWMQRFDAGPSGPESSDSRRRRPTGA